MPGRSQHATIPIEILRTVALVCDLGSFGKAGERLGLSQPAISAQMKRLQTLVGGPVFDRVAGGVAFNDRGKLLLPHIRRLLEANDQILALSGTTSNRRLLRVGILDIYAQRVLGAYEKSHHGDVGIVCADTGELMRGLSEGYVDVACSFLPNATDNLVAVQWTEDYAWARSTGLAVSPGSPIPVIGSLGFLSDKSAVQALDRKGLAYRLVLQSSDHLTRIRAAAAGLGFLALPTWAIEAPLVTAREHYLPALPALKAAVTFRPGADSSQLRRLVGLLGTLAPRGLPEEIRA